MYSSVRWDTGEHNMDRVDAYQNISRYPNIQAIKLHVVFLYLASTDDLHFVPLFLCSFIGHISCSFCQFKPFKVTNNRSKRLGQYHSCSVTSRLIGIMQSAHRANFGSYCS